MWSILKFIFKFIIILVLLVTTFFIFLNLVTKPSNSREWSEDQAILPEVKFLDENKVSIKNIRNFSYKTTSDYTPNYYDKTFNIDKLSKVYFVMEPFKDFTGAAHTFLSFEFEDNSYVSISVEIRKEKGELFSTIKGFLNQYELTYVIADERDVVKLRSNFRKDDVYIYPVNTSKEKVKELFVDMLKRTDKLSREPEFYNTLFNNCTTNIVRHANKLREEKIKISRKIIFPAYSDELAYNLGLIDTDLTFREARLKFRINDRAQTYAEDPNFSVMIRK